MTTLSIDFSMLENVAPMIMAFDRDGRISRVGRALERVAPGAVGRPIGDVLHFIYPALPPDADSLFGQVGRRLRVHLLAEANVPDDEPPVIFRGAVIPLADGSGLLQLGLGADPALALQRHRLTAKDFAQTDPTVDYLYLIEVHGLLHSEYESLSDRLDLAKSEAERAAVTDKLTGLHNRRALDAHLKNLSHPGARPFGLMQLDLDYFKAVNDSLGHAAGDRVLKEVARILSEEVRSDDMVARVGGDEFMLVFDNCIDSDLLRLISDRIIARLEEPIQWEGNHCNISGSVGITMSTFYDNLQPERLILDVDAALYASKRAGRARTSVADPARGI